MAVIDRGQRWTHLQAGLTGRIPRAGVASRTYVRYDPTWRGMRSSSWRSSPTTSPSSISALSTTTGCTTSRSGSDQLGLVASHALAAWERRGLWTSDQSRTSTGRLSRELNSRHAPPRPCCAVPDDCPTCPPPWPRSRRHPLARPHRSARRRPHRRPGTLRRRRAHARRALRAAALLRRRARRRLLEATRQSRRRRRRRRRRHRQRHRPPLRDDRRHRHPRRRPRPGQRSHRGRRAASTERPTPPHRHPRRHRAQRRPTTRSGVGRDGDPLRLHPGRDTATTPPVHRPGRRRERGADL